MNKLEAALAEISRNQVVLMHRVNVLIGLLSQGKGVPSRFSPKTVDMSTCEPESILFDPFSGVFTTSALRTQGLLVPALPDSQQVAQVGREGRNERSSDLDALLDEMAENQL